ncbi:cobalamin biosynthesis protein [Tateyamaria sp. SN6-1]|uniref:cobalamin biosynthesis protein n=1 Tax=Tateyamaria sp. SN6-1 TaxID=3092148 RepID=UPI0039F50095
MIIAGLGFTTRATAQSLADALAATGLDSPPDALATAHDKAAHPALLDFARRQNLSIHAVQPHALEQARTETQSMLSHQTRNTGSVAEAAALAAAGPDATLTVPRQISPDRMATCAIAQGATS